MYTCIQILSINYKNKSVRERERIMLSERKGDTIHQFSCCDFLTHQPEIFTSEYIYIYIYKNI